MFFYLHSSTYLYCVYSNSRSSYIEVVQEDALRRCTRERAAHKRQTVDVFASFLDTTIDERRLLTLLQLCEQQNIVVEQHFLCSILREAITLKRRQRTE